VLQNPLALGADLIVHSTTKYINGHSDIVGGAVVSRTKDLHDQMAWWANCLGTTGAPFDSFLTLRGIRTLEVRVRQQTHNAQQVAEFLNAHPAVSRVYYPGLPSHPGHDIAARQQKGFGAMLSFELAGGIESAKSFVAGLKLFSFAESLGGFESLVAHPVTMTHAAMDPQAREEAGIKDNLLRLSIGMESAQDLIADLKEALAPMDASSKKNAASAIKL
jgi:cystathionine gamma-synthase